MASLMKEVYVASSNLTVTNLNSLASSSSFLSGWTSGTIDNTTNLYLDHLISAQITAGTSLTAGEIRMYAYSMLDDSNWFDLFSSGTEGTEGAATIHDTELLDNPSLMRLLCVTATDTTNSQVYPLGSQSIRAVYNGFLPPKVAIYIAHSMVGALASSGNQVTVKSDYLNLNA